MHWINAIASVVSSLWQMLGLIFVIMRSMGRLNVVPRFWKRIFLFLRPFFIPAQVAIALDITLSEHGFLMWISVAFTICVTLIAWNMYKDIFKDDDDDPWKRFKRRVTETIKQVGSRLVLVPATNNA